MGRRRLTIVVQPKVIVVRGWKAGDLCREAGLKPLWSAPSGGWLLDLRRLPDLVAHAEYRNIAITVEDSEAA